MKQLRDWLYTQRMLWALWSPLYPWDALAIVAMFAGVTGALAAKCAGWW